MRTQKFTADELRQLLHYDPQTGVFTRISSKRGDRVGEIAGTLRPDGYLTISVHNVQHRAQRLAWLYMTGMWPRHQIDHKDGNRSSNKWSNLRDATARQNRANMKGHGKLPKGVSFIPGRYGRALSRPYQAQICVNYCRRYLGTFETAEEAHAAYRIAAVELNGEFARFE